MGITVQKTMNRDAKKMLKKIILEGILLGRTTISEITDYVTNNIPDNLPDNAYIYSLLTELERDSFIKKYMVKGYSYYYINYKYYSKACELYGVRYIHEIVNLQKPDHDKDIEKICEELEYYNFKTIKEYPINYTDLSNKQRNGRIDIAVTKNDDEVVFGIEYETGGNPPVQFLNNCVKMIEFKKPTIVLTPPQLFGYYKMWLSSFFNGGVKRNFEVEAPVYLMNVNDFLTIKKIPSDEILYVKFPQDINDVEINLEIQTEEHENTNDTENIQNLENLQNTNNITDTTNPLSQNQLMIQPIPSIDKQYADILQKIEELITQWKDGKEQEAIIFAQILHLLQSISDLNNQQLDLQNTHSTLLTNIDTKMNTSLNTQEEIKTKVTHTNAILNAWDYNLLKKYQLIILILLGIVVAYTGLIIGYYMYL
jgi:hypothetical protein